MANVCAPKFQSYHVTSHAQFFLLTGMHCLLGEKNKMAVRKTDGGPDLKYYESPETTSLFEPVKQFLLKNHKKVISLLLFVFKLMLF